MKPGDEVWVTWCDDDGEHVRPTRGRVAAPMTCGFWTIAWSNKDEEYTGQFDQAEVFSTERDAIVAYYDRLGKQIEQLRAERRWASDRAVEIDKQPPTAGDAGKE